MPGNRETITAKKFFSGVVSPTTGVKALAFLPWLLLFLAIGWAVWVTFIQPHTKWAEKTQEQQIIVQPGATAVIQQKTDAPKRHLILFAEPWFGVSTKNDKGELGARVGCRWEF